MIAKWRKLNLRHNRDFLQKSKKIYFSFFTVLYVVGEDFSFNVVISKKVAAKAVERNRIKRLIFSEVAKEIEIIELKKVRFLIILKKLSSENNIYDQLRNDLRNFIKKL